MSTIQEESESLPDPPVVRYLARRDFGTKINGVTLAFKKGQLIDQPTILVQMLAEGAPIDPVLDEGDLMICPHCGMASSRGAMEGARALLRRAKQIMPGHV